MVYLNIQMIYANFFSPQTISLLFCLHESSLDQNDKHPRSDLVQYLIGKILATSESKQLCTSNEAFEAQLLSATNNMQFVDRYRACLGKITCFNDFYRDLSKMLKSLRSLRNNKLQQGNLVDFLVRRMYIYFQKLDFKDIVGVYQKFAAYLKGQEVRGPQHEFMLTKSIEEVRFNLENYSAGVNPQDLAAKVLELGENDHTFKTSYLGALVGSGSGKAVGSIQGLHRYFDKSLGNLFPQKGQTSAMGNKINHCILSSAFINLRMGFLEQCLQSISQGLRISQNNSDEQSINNCIIYLYKISEQLGKHAEQILLNQHAITHSLNLGNVLLMVYSCWHYSRWQRKYNCADPDILLLKHRNINWTDALGFARKKIYSTFESNCKNIYHTHRSLLIPAFITKLTVLTHLPQLKELLLNPYYQRQELMQLDVYQEFNDNTPLDQDITKLSRYIKNGQTKMVHKTSRELTVKMQKASSPLEIIKLQSVLNKASFANQTIDAHNSAQTLICLCKNYGFVKEEMLDQMLVVSQLLIKNHMYSDAAVRLTKARQHAIQQKLDDYQAVFRLLQAQVGLRLGQELEETAQTIASIQRSTLMAGLRPQFGVIFQQTKLTLYRCLEECILNQPDFKNELYEFRKNQLTCLRSIFNLHQQQKNIAEMLATVQKIEKLTHNNSNVQQLQMLKAYLQKTICNFSTIDFDDFDQDQLSRRIHVKISQLWQKCQ